jgi:hypothetical protein
LHEYRFAAIELAKHRQQPIVEAAHFEHRQIASFPGGLIAKCGEEFADLHWLGRNLPPECDDSLLVAQVYG